MTPRLSSPPTGRVASPTSQFVGSPPSGAGPGLNSRPSSSRRQEPGARILHLSGGRFPTTWRAARGQLAPTKSVPGRCAPQPPAPAATHPSPGDSSGCACEAPPLLFVAPYSPRMVATACRPSCSAQKRLRGYAHTQAQKPADFHPITARPRCFRTVPGATVSRVEVVTVTTWRRAESHAGHPPQRTLGEVQLALNAS